MKTTAFYPDYTNLLDVVSNKRPKRLPLYEHHIDVPFIAKALNTEIKLQGNAPRDLREYYTKITDFWQKMTYDAFDYEASVCDIFPGHGAIFGGKPGPIQNRDDFEKYPFSDIPKIFWAEYSPHLEAIRAVMPAGMKAYGGCGYGIFEAGRDLAGYETLCTTQYLDPELFADLFRKIGDLYKELWSEMVERYSDIFVFFRMGDDLGYKTSTLLAPEIIRAHIIPQYKRIIYLIRNAGKRFLFHSCGNIFDLMEDLIAAGIDAKHSNEDQIAPFSKWIELYSPRIGLLGGIDVNVLCLLTHDEVYNKVLSDAAEFRKTANGFGLGSGNSITTYVPVEGFMAMIEAAKEIRRRER